MTNVIATNAILGSLILEYDSSTFVDFSIGTNKAKCVVFTLIGGGGGGGPAEASPSGGVDRMAVGGPGGSGSIGQVTLQAADLVGGTTITIGAGGTSGNGGGDTTISMAAGTWTIGGGGAPAIGTAISTDGSFATQTSNSGGAPSGLFDWGLLVINTESGGGSNNQSGGGNVAFQWSSPSLFGFGCQSALCSGTSPKVFANGPVPNPVPAGTGGAPGACLAIDSGTESVTGATGGNGRVIAQVFS